MSQGMLFAVLSSFLKLGVIDYAVNNDDFEDQKEGKPNIIFNPPTTKK